MTVSQVLPAAFRIAARVFTRAQTLCLALSGLSFILTVLAVLKPVDDQSGRLGVALAGFLTAVFLFCAWLSRPASSRGQVEAAAVTLTVLAAILLVGGVWSLAVGVYDYGWGWWGFGGLVEVLLILAAVLVGRAGYQAWRQRNAA